MACRALSGVKSGCHSPKRAAFSPANLSLIFIKLAISLDDSFRHSVISCWEYLSNSGWVNCVVAKGDSKSSVLAGEIVISIIPSIVILI